MKGFKDSNNKFHPITSSKGVRKSRDQSAKSVGVKLERKSRIFQDDPDAVSKLEVKLARLEKEKAYWKALKPVPRTYQANEPDGALRSFMLPNLNANIRTVRQKIELIKSRQEKNIGLERKTTFKNGRKVFYYEEVRKAREQEEEPQTEEEELRTGYDAELERALDDELTQKLDQRDYRDIVRGRKARVTVNGKKVSILPESKELWEGNSPSARLKLLGREKGNAKIAKLQWKDVPDNKKLKFSTGIEDWSAKIS